MDNLFTAMKDAAGMAVSFALCGGECDELVRFLQLEWESYADEPKKAEYHTEFYHNLTQYKAFRQDPPRNWREDFSGRDFSKLVI